MNCKNLLPPTRQAALRRRRAVRRWTLLNGGYLGLLVVAGAIFAYSTAAPAPANEATANLNTLNSTLTTLRQQNATLTTNLRAVQEITQRPDWSVLLAVLADALGEDMVLEAIDGTAPANASDALPQPQRLRLVAVARSQAAVTQFILRLEALKLFARVQLEKTVAQVVGGTDGVRFQVTCSIVEEAGR